jgi:hypothetical protein
MIDEEKDDVQSEPEAAVSADALAIGQPGDAVVEPEDETAEPTEPGEEQAEGEATAEPAGEGVPRIVLKRSGAETDHVFELHPPSIIGRFDPAVGPIDVDLGPLDEGRYVSRKHAKITFEDGIWILADMGSSNGTFILHSDFEKVDEIQLTDGCEFALGNARFVFHLS